MKNIFSLSFFLACILLLLSCSSKEGMTECCICKENETWIANECYPDESVHSLGGAIFIAPNSYVGITSCNQCIDTLVFFNDTTRAVNNGRFGLVVSDRQGGIQNVAGFYPSEVSNNEFLLGTAAPLCYLNGEGWYAHLHFIIEPDNVWMQLKFWTINTEPGVVIDSCIVNFYKK